MKNIKILSIEKKAKSTNSPFLVILETIKHTFRQGRREGG